MFFPADFFFTWRQKQLENGGNVNRQKDIQEIIWPWDPLNLPFPTVSFNRDPTG